MKDIYRMEFPSEVILGRDIIDRLPDEIEHYGFKDPLYIVGRYTRRFVDGDHILIRDTLKEDLDEIDVGNHDVLVGVGGGKNLDSAKYLSKRTGLPYILVPTLPSSDGISSPAISLITRDGRVSLLHHPPLFIFIDQSIVNTSPRRYVLSGYGDIVAKYSSLYDWWLGHIRRGEYYGYLTSKLIKFSFNHIVSNRKILFDPEGIHILLESLILSGGTIGIQGTSRPASGSEHLISHALDMLRIREGNRPGLHGIQVGLATIFTTYLQGRNWRFVRKILSDVGFPVTLDGADIDEDLFVDAVLLAPRIRGRYTILNEVELTYNRVRSIIEEVGLV